ncbi:MAG TPA: ABC transporter permease, partial [Candidatus Manganitrophaceae bacterium]
FRVKGFLKAKGPARAQDGAVAVIDIASAQWRLEKLGKLDRIDLILDGRASPEKVMNVLSERLGGRVHVARPEQRSAQVEKTLRAFQLNLTALSGVSLFVGIFLIYNTLLVSVARRRKEIGVLRALGVDRGQIFRIFTLEGLMIGAAGGIAGVFAGAFLARSVLQLVSRTVTSLYVSIPPSPLSLPPSVFLEGVGIGALVATLSSLLPALQAGWMRPREAMEGIYTSRRPLNHWRFFVGALFFGLLSWALSRVALAWNPPAAGHLSAAALLISFSLLAPSAIHLFSRAVQPILSPLRPEWRLAHGHLQQAIRRNAPTIAAFMAALSMMISVVIMIESFRDTVTLWIDQTIKADLILAPVSLLEKESQETLPEGLIGELKTDPDVEAVDGYRALPILFRNEPARLVGRDLSIHSRYSRYLFKQGNSQEIIQKAIQGKEVLVSEIFANRFHLKEGERIEIPSPSGPLPFKIGGIFYEYTTDGGKMVIDRSVLKQYWGDERIDVAGVYLKKAQSAESTRGKLVHSMGSRYGLAIVTQVSFKKEIMNIFDQTFLITYGLEWIAIVVALIGIANTLFVSVLERAREIGIMRAIGSSDRQVVRIVMMEAFYMGLIGHLLSVLCSIFLSLLLVYVINKQSFGWSLLFHFPPSILLHSFLLAVLTALAAGCFPARYAAKMKVTEAIAYE